MSFLYSCAPIYSPPACSNAIHFYIFRHNTFNKLKINNNLTKTNSLSVKSNSSMTYYRNDNYVIHHNQLTFYIYSISHSTAVPSNKLTTTQKLSLISQKMLLINWKLIINIPGVGGISNHL